MIASVEGETLILTACHVIAKPGPIFIEKIHRYNFGVEHVQAVTGFPRRVEATVMVKDADTDLAISSRIREPVRFPYVARIARGDDPPGDRGESDDNRLRQRSQADRFLDQKSGWSSGSTCGRGAASARSS